MSFLHTAYTIEDQTATKHETKADALKAANARTGRIAGVSWTRTILPTKPGLGVMIEEKGDHEGELFALVFSADPLTTETVVDSFGLDFVDFVGAPIQPRSR